MSLDPCNFKAKKDDLRDQPTVYRWRDLEGRLEVKGSCPHQDLPTANIVSGDRMNTSVCRVILHIPSRRYSLRIPNLHDEWLESSLLDWPQAEQVTSYRDQPRHIGIAVLWPPKQSRRVEQMD